MNTCISLRDLARSIAKTIDPLEQDTNGSADELRTLARLEESFSLSGSAFLTGVLYLANRPCVRQRHADRRAIHFGWLAEHVALWRTLAEALRYGFESSAPLSGMYLFEADALEGWANYRAKYRLDRR